MKRSFWNILVIINFCVIFYFWFLNSQKLLNGNEPGDLWIAFGRLTGLLSQLFIIIQLVLVSRFSLIEVEYGLDKLINLHKKIGTGLGVFILSHPIFLTIGYAKRGDLGLLDQFISFQHWDDILPATISLIIILLVAFLSAKKIRIKLKYEFWYFSHLLLYIAVFLAFGHQINTSDMSDRPAVFYWIALNLVVILVLVSYRFVRPMINFFEYKFKVNKIVKENDNVFSIYITGNNIEKYKFNSGQFATLIFLQKGKWFHHPFSFSDISGNKYLRFTIKSSGDFTSKLNELKEGIRVWIDGPFGVFSLNKSVNDKYLFIAGGIGISPIVSIIKSIVTKDAILMYSNRQEKDVVLQNDIDNSLVKTHYFFTDKDPNNMITIDKIKNLVPDFIKRDIYICGPLSMSRALNAGLIGAGVSKKQIHFEKFDF